MEQTHNQPTNTQSYPPSADPLADYMQQNEFLDKYDRLFNRSQLRWMLREREKNGLRKMEAVKKVAGRLYIHVPRFTKWIDSRPS